MVKNPTSRELSLLRLRSEGLSQCEISQRLGVSQPYVCKALALARWKCVQAKGAGQGHEPLFSERLRRILTLSKEGYSQEHIALMEHISQSAVSQHLQAAKRRTQRILAFSLSPGQKKVFMLLEKGLMQKDIARELGISQPAVSHAMRAIKRKFSFREQLRAVQG